MATKKDLKSKKIKILTIIINIILLIATIILSFLVLKNDILPLKHLIIYFILVILIPIIILIFLLKEKTNFKIKIILIIFDIIYLIILLFSLFVVFQSLNFLDNVHEEAGYVTKNYLVLVPNNSSYQKIKELNGKKIGYVELEKGLYDKAFIKVKQLITFEGHDYPDYNLMFQDLTKGEIEAFIITDSYYDILGDEIEDIKNSYRVIYQFSLDERLENIAKDIDVSDSTFNIYISGIDTYGSISTVSRSDVNIVLSINPKTNQILMVNIPRDYYVTFHGEDAKDKLTHVGLYGMDISIATIEDLLNIDINYYFKVNFNSLIGLVDALDGVNVYSKYSFISAGSYYFQEGFNHVNGKQALAFSRTRKAFLEGDRTRGENQQAMIDAIIKKAISPLILTKYTKILKSLDGSFVTNMPTEKITNLIKMQLEKNPHWNTTSISLNGEDGYDYTKSMPNQKLYVMVPYEETITTAQAALEDVLNDKILASSYQDNDSGKIYIPYIPSKN